MNVGSVWAASGDITASATAGTDTSLTAITADSESYLYYYSMPSVSTAADTEISATDSAGNTYTGSVKLTSGTVVLQLTAHLLRVRRQVVKPETML